MTKKRATRINVNNRWLTEWRQRGFGFHHFHSHSILKLLSSQSVVVGIIVLSRFIRKFYFSSLAAWDLSINKLSSAVWRLKIHLCGRQTTMYAHPALAAKRYSKTASPRSGRCIGNQPPFRIGFVVQRLVGRARTMRAMLLSRRFNSEWVTMKPIGETVIIHIVWCFVFWSTFECISFDRNVSMCIRTVSVCPSVRPSKSYLLYIGTYYNDTTGTQGSGTCAAHMHTVKAIALAALRRVCGERAEQKRPATTIGR